MTAASGGSYHSLDGEVRATPSGSPRTRSSPAGIIDLAAARDDRRLRDYQARLRSVLETNRRALARLFQSGLIYSRAGARLGRDLLLAHQHLLRVGDLLARLHDLAGCVPPGRRGRGAEAEALYAQVQSLLVRTSELSARSDGLLARER